MKAFSRLRYTLMLGNFDKILKLAQVHHQTLTLLKRSQHPPTYINIVMLTTEKWYLFALHTLLSLST